MENEPVVLDTDTLSELSRGHPVVRERALAYLAGFGRLTITAITVFERLRGYRLALRDGKPFERQLQAFEALVANCIVLPFDQEAASVFLPDCDAELAYVASAKRFTPSMVRNARRAMRRLRRRAFNTRIFHPMGS